ncbi:hypothetical protein AGMMS49992_28240 [Clostridia bacterium]|nr:hypothetical protein AGMMS49992_28240 [Clostridia bacterium]
MIIFVRHASSPYYNPYYEIEVVRRGLLTGFIPVNMAFGGYQAKHYLGAITTPEFLKPVSSNASYTESTHESNVRVIRVQDTDHRGAAQLTISDTFLSFNVECKSYFPGDCLIEILLHPRERMLAVRKTHTDNPNGIRWVSASISASAFLPILYELMGWNLPWRHRILAIPFMRDGDTVLLFDLNDPEYIMYEEILPKEDDSMGNDEQCRHRKPPKPIRRRVGNPMQSQRWRNGIGADASSWMRSRIPVNSQQVKMHINAPALPVNGYPGNPSRMDETQLKDYLETQGGLTNNV